MRLTILAVGRARAGPERTLVADYLGRLRWPTKLVEIAASDSPKREGAALAAKLPPGARPVALDRSGKGLSSEEFAARLGKWRDAGAAEIAFLIGGAEGLDPNLVARADLVLSLGAMVWPHMLARIMLAEQLFRAQSILAGHPYHRGG